MQTLPVRFTLADDNAPVLAATPKVFSSGKRGYHATGKITDAEGRTFQVNCMVVLVKSGPGEANESVEL